MRLCVGHISLQQLLGGRIHTPYSNPNGGGRMEGGECKGENDAHVQLWLPACPLPAMQGRGKRLLRASATDSRCHRPAEPPAPGRETFNTHPRKPSLCTRFSTKIILKHFSEAFSSGRATPRCFPPSSRERQTRYLLVGEQEGASGHAVLLHGGEHQQSTGARAGPSGPVPAGQVARARRQAPKRGQMMHACAANYT